MFSRLIFLFTCFLLVLTGPGCFSLTVDNPPEESSADIPQTEVKKMGGIVFFNTADLETMKQFYLEKVGCTLWLDQGSCLIFQHGNMLLSFCQSNSVEKEGIITFFYTDKEQVDRMYEKLQDIAADLLRENPRYRIYHFFARDPEGRRLEFQYFNHPLPPF